MSLKSQDILVLLKIIALQRQDWSYRQLASELDVGLGEIHRSIKRSVAGDLARKVDARKNSLPVVDKNALLKFIQFGVRHVFPTQRGTLSIGMATSFAAPGLIGHIEFDELQLPIWPDPEGSVRGYIIEPLYRSVVFAAKQDQRLYEMLALLDAVRDGRARERKLAIEFLSERFDL